MRQRIADGQPLYGNSRLSDYTQGVAHGHSKGSADMLCPSLLPFLLRSPLRPLRSSSSFGLANLD